MEDWDPNSVSWLSESLVLSRDLAVLEGSVTEKPEAAFSLRCEEAGRAVWELARLRHERERAGFAPLSVGTYLRDLARAADIDLLSVLSLFGLSEIALRGGGAAARSSLARLCRELGMSMRETFVHLGLGLAEGRSQIEPWGALRARGQVSFAGPLEEGERFLRRALAQNGEAAASELRALEAEVLALYES